MPVFYTMAFPDRVGVRRGGGRGKAVQVDIRFNPGLKALGCQPVESASLSEFWFEMV